MNKWLKKALVFLCCVTMSTTLGVGLIACGGNNGGTLVPPISSESTGGTSDSTDGSSDSTDGSSDSTDGSSDSTDGSSDSTDGSSDSTPEHEHEYTEDEAQAVPATCSSKGKKVLVCSCGDSKEEEVAELPHTEVIDEAVEATCKETGLTEGKHCSVCKTVIVAQEEVAKSTVHTEVIDEAVEATCTSAGLTEGKHCSVCDKVIVAQEEVKKLAHTFTEEVASDKYEASKASCTAQATYYKSCKCGEASKDEVFAYGDKKAHAWEESVEEQHLKQAATCDYQAIYVKSCAVCDAECDEENANFVVGTALGHLYHENVVAPTCTADGYTEVTCDRDNCNYTTTKDRQEATGHLYADLNREPVVTEPTCTERGYTTYFCVCGLEKQDNFVEKIDHSYKSAETRAATCLEAGVMTYTCVCGDSYTEEIKIKDHEYQKDESAIVAPTCEEHGYTPAYCINGCNDMQEEDIVPATGHSYTASESVVTAATCETDGVKNVYCACGAFEERAIPATGHNYSTEVVAAKCGEQGYTVHTCANANCEEPTYRDSYTPARVHNYEQTNEVKAACGVKGAITYTCSYDDCGHSYDEETAALEHEYNTEWTLVVDGDNKAVLTHVEGCLYHKTYTNVCIHCNETQEKTEDEYQHECVAAITQVATCQVNGVKTFTCQGEGCDYSYTQEYSDPEAHVWVDGETSAKGVITQTCSVDGCGKTNTTFKAGGTEAAVSKEVWEEAGEVQLDAATIKMDEATLGGLGEGDTSLHASTLDETAKKEVIEAATQLSKEEKEKLENANIFNFTLQQGGEYVTKFDGTMTVTVRYDLAEGEDPELISVWYIGENGELEKKMATYTEIDGVGYATFETTHFSRYTVVRLTPSERCAIYGHDLKVRTVYETCTTDGYKLEYCIRCGLNEIKETYTATGHNYVAEVTEATCTTKGFTRYTCTQTHNGVPCGASYVSDYQEANGHAYENEGAVTVYAPDCIKKGYTYYQCDNCAYNYCGDYVDALGHELKDVVTDATCTAMGYTTHSCDRCSYVFVDTYVAALGHNYQADEVVAPGCVTRGYTVMVCANGCGSRYNGAYTPATGHSYEEEVTAPTCYAMGYTTYTCACGASYIANYTAKVAHNYEHTVVAPTCSAMGYTEHVCKTEGCNESYKDTYVDMIAHDYVAGETKAPTCTEKGYTQYQCSACEKNYKDDFVEALGHNYVAFICDRCGQKHPMLDYGKRGFYMNLIESSMEAETYFITAENFTVSVSELRNGELDYSTDVVVEFLNISFGIDENGYIVGYGDMKADVKMFEIWEGIEDTTGGIATVKAVFVGGKMYVCPRAETLYGSSTGEVEEIYLAFTQEYLEEQGFAIRQMKAMYEEIVNEDVQKIFDDILNNNSSTMNFAIGQVVEYVFVKTETADGYTFTLNYDRAFDLYNALTQQTIAQLFDGVFGENAFDTFVDYLYDAAAMTVGELEATIREDLKAEYSIDLDDLYFIANRALSLMSPEPVDVSAMIADMADVKISDLLDEAFGAEEPMNYQEMILQLAEMFRQETVVSLIGNTGGMGAPEGGMGEPTVSSSNSWTDGGKDYSSTIEVTDKYYGDLVEEETEEVVDEVTAILEYIVNCLSGSHIGFTTDKDGNLVSYNIHINELEFDYETKSMEDSGYGEESPNATVYRHTIKINGKLDVIANGEFSFDATDIIAKGEELFKDASTLKAGDKLDDYVIYEAADGTLVMAREFNLNYLNKEPEILRTETIDGVEYVVARVMTYDSAYVLGSEVNYVMHQDSCGDWKQYYINGQYVHQTSYLLWVNTNAKNPEDAIYKTEIDLEYMQMYMDGNSNVSFWKNSNGELAKWEVHDYEVTDRKEIGEGCNVRIEETNTCKNCGDSYTSSWTKGHNEVRKAELLPGANNCLEGIKFSYVCVDCGFVLSEHVEYNTHMYYDDYYVTETDCGELRVEYWGCACGLNAEQPNIHGNCNFEQVSVDKGQIGEPNEKGEYEGYYQAWTIVCKDCGYTMSFYEERIYEGCTVKQSFALNIGVAEDGTAEYVFAKTASEKRHNSRDQETTIDPDTGIRTVTYFCYECGEILETYQYDQYDRTIYYYNVERNSGYSREWNGCQYVQYEFVGEEIVNQYEGESHKWTDRYELMGSTCSDGVNVYSVCTVCGEEEYYSTREGWECYEFAQYYSQEFGAACGEIVFNYAICPCGKSFRPDKVLSNCELETVEENYFTSEDGTTATQYEKVGCTKCGYVIETNLQMTRNGCFVTVVGDYYRANVREDGSCDWNLPVNTSYYQHIMTDYVTEDNGIRTVVYGCESCGYEEYVETYDEFNRQISYENKQSGYRWYREYNGCYYTQTTIEADGHTYTYEGEDHNTDRKYELMEGVTSCVDGFYEINYCIVCGEVFDRYENGGHHPTNGRTYYQTKTACGYFELYGYQCPCGYESNIWVTNNSCYIDYGVYGEIENTETTYSEYTLYRCENCDFAYKVVEYSTLTENCVWETTYTYFVNVDDEGNGGEEACSYTRKETRHNYEWVDGEDGENRIRAERCIGCGWISYEEKWDSYGRHLGYTDYDESGYYYSHYKVYDENCNFVEYYSNSDGENHETGWTGQDHAWTYRKELNPNSITCNDGWTQTEYCAACGMENGSWEYYYHEYVYEDYYVTETECGKLVVRRGECLCGEYVEQPRIDEWNCNFECSGENFYDEVSGEWLYGLETCTCYNCGFTYTVKRYYAVEGCSEYEYCEYTLDVDGDAFTWTNRYLSNTNHQNLKVREGATDDDIYQYEEYCEDCGETFVHYAKKDDASGRRVFYYDFLKMRGYETVYSTVDCSYTTYAIVVENNAFVRGEVTEEGYEHGEIRYYYALLDGSVTCTDGVRGVYYCKECGMEEVYPEVYYSHNGYYHYETFVTHCGEMEVSYVTCACGEKVGNQVNYNGNCLVEWNGSAYVCAVTACDFEISYVTNSEHLKEQCAMYVVYTYHVSGDVNGKEITFNQATSYTQHTIVNTDETIGGIRIIRAACQYCNYFAEERYDSLGRQIYQWTGYDGWEREFCFENPCEYEGYPLYRNENGEIVRNGDWYTGDIHSWQHYETYVTSCTQYQTWFYRCTRCGLAQEYDYVTPHHDYYYDEVKGLYVCYNCGLENEKGVDAYFTVEDLSNTYGSYVAGFYNQVGGGWQAENGYNFYVFLNFDVDAENPYANAKLVEVGFELIEYGHEESPDGSGIIKLNMDELNAAIDEAYGVNWEGFESVSIVFQVFDKDKGYDYFDVVLTFDRL